jgi:hypothetical protein
MKKSAKELLYFGLDCGMLKFFTFRLQAATQRAIDASPGIMKYGSVKKIAV